MSSRSWPRDCFGRPVPQLDRAGRLRRDWRRAGLEVYFPYFTVQTRFDDARAQALGLAPPPLAATSTA